MPKPPKDIKAFKHTAAKRTHIPSAGEAGSEAASPAVQSGPGSMEIPLNPVVHRGQDPELFRLGKYGDQENAAEPATTVDLRPIHRREHIAPEQIIRSLHRTVETDEAQPDLLARDSAGVSYLRKRWATEFGTSLLATQARTALGSRRAHSPSMRW